MNEQLESALFEVLGDIKTAKDFAISEAPEVVRQMVVYEATVAWIGVATGIILLAITAFMVYACWRIDQRQRAEAANFGKGLGDAWIPVSVVSALSVVLLCIMVGLNLVTAIKATWFPKWFIVEKMMALL